MRSRWVGVATGFLLALSDGHAQALSRPPLLQERLMPQAVAGQVPLQAVWPRALVELGLRDAVTGDDTPMAASDCVHATALETLRRLRRQFGAKGSYVLTWARNQDRVFSACDERSRNATAPVPPIGKDLPSRARSDFLYQLGSWHFYKGEHAAALTLFQQVGRMRNAPQRALAAYMEVRTLAYLRRLDDAYAAIDRTLADPGLREVHRIAANYRFVIMSNTNSFASRDAGLISLPLAKRHLRWLLDLAGADPERAADPMLAAADAKDAREQLAIYFPYQDPQGQVDWWLRQARPDSVRMQAVQDLAPLIPMVDWLQASWATNIFDTDWLWALHDDQNPYWQGNASIVAHAWQRWQQDGDGAWLQVAIERVHPSDALAPAVLVAAHAYLAHPWTDPRQPASAAYTRWVLSLWDNAVRLHLGRGETAEAIAFVEHGRDIERDPAGSETLLPLQRQLGFAFTADRALRWLVYRGETEAARSLLDVARKRHPHGFRKWRSLLATQVDEAHAAGETLPVFPYRLPGIDDPNGWERLVDDLGSEALYRLASGTVLQQGYRALFARTALARALILGYDEPVVDRYAALAGQLNPSMREQLLAGVASHRRSDYVRLLLRSPRLRPAVLAEYASREEGADAAPQGRGPAPDAIDVYNHNDNNWWCAFDQAHLRERAFDAWRIVPTGGRHFVAERVKADIEPYLARQRELLAAHPYRALVDAREVRALEAIPSGPRFLSEAVIARENADATELPPEERSERAADLHRAVRTTRYGCERNGSHAEYSRAAFRLLHDRYEDTPWAKATPYWFK